jgi:hypothetical protein
LLSPTSRLLVDELLRLTALLQRAATPRDVIAAIRGDPKHRLRPAFRDLAHQQNWPARLAWLVNRARLEQGLPLVLGDPVVLHEDQEDTMDEMEERSRRQRALTAAMESLTDAYAAHWPAIVEADGDALARQLLGLLEWARPRAG